MKKILLVMGFLLIASHGWSKNWLWTSGADNTDWEDDGNWSNDETGVGHPGTGSADHVFIRFVPPTFAVPFPKYPVLDSSLSIRSLTIDTAGQLTISNGATLTVTGDDSNSSATGAPRTNSANDPKPFVLADASVNNAVYQKNGTIILSGGTLSTPNGSVYQIAGSVAGTGAAAIQAAKGITLNASGSSNCITAIGLSSSNGDILLKNASGGTLTVTASTGAAGKNIEITETGAIAIAAPGIETATGGTVYLSANTITQTGIIETPALWIRSSASSGAIVLDGNNKVGVLAASSNPGDNFSFTNVDPLVVGSAPATAPGGAITGVSAGTGIIALTADAMTFNAPVGDYSIGSHVILRNKSDNIPIGLDASTGGLDLAAASVNNIKTKTLEVGSRSAPSTTTITIGSLPPSPNEIDTLILRCSAALSISSLSGSVTSLGIDCGGDATVSVSVANLAVDSGGVVNISSTRTAGFFITSLGSPAITGLKGSSIAISAAGAVSQQSTAPVVTAGTLTLGGGTGAAYTLTAAAAGNDIGTLVSAAPHPASVVYTDKNSFSVGAAGLTTTAGPVTLTATGGSITVGGAITTTLAGTAGDVTLTTTGSSGNITVNNSITAGGTASLTATGSGGNVTVNNNITAAGDATLTAGTGAGVVTVNAGVGSAGGSITMDAGARIDIDGGVSITSGGTAITMKKPVRLLTNTPGSVTIGRSGGANPAISFQGSLDGARNLILNSGSGAVNFTGTVGASTSLGDGTGNAFTINAPPVTSPFGDVTFNSTVKVNGLLDIYSDVVFKNSVDINAANTGTSYLRGNVDIQGVTVINTNRSISFGTFPTDTVTGNARLDIVASGTTAALGTITLNGAVSIGGSSSGSPPRSLYIDAASLSFPGGISTAGANGGAGGNIFFRIDGLTLSNIDAATADVQITPRTDTHIIEFGDSNDASIAEQVFYSSGSFGGITAGSFTIGDTTHNGKIYLSGTGAAGIAVTFQTKQDIEFTGDYTSNGEKLNLETNGGKVLIGGTGPRTINLKGSALDAADMVFNAPVENVGTPGDHGLTVTANVVTFNQPVGGTNHLGAVTINHSGTFTTNKNNNAHIFADGGFTETALSGTPINSIGGNITTNNAAITLNNDTTLTQGVSFGTGSGAGDITIKGTVGNNASAGLTLNAGTGAVFLEKPVNLSNGGVFSSDGTGTATLGTGSTSGNITTISGNKISFAGPVTLANNTTLSTGTGAGNISITGASVTAITGLGKTLALNAGTGEVAVSGGSIGTSTDPLGTIGITGGVVSTEAIFSSAVTTVTNSGVYTINGDISSTGGFIQNGTGGVVIGGTGGNRSITTTDTAIQFARAINGVAGSGLSLNAGSGLITLSGAVGDTYPIGNATYGFTVTSTNTAANAISISQNVKVDGKIEFAGNVMLTGTGTAISVETSDNDGDIVFNGTVQDDTANHKNFAVITHGNGEVYFYGDVTAGRSPKSGYAISINSAEYHLDTNVDLVACVNGDILLKVDGQDLIGTNSIDAGTGDIQLTPRSTAFSIEYGDSPLIPLTTLNHVYYSSTWGSAFIANSFTVGDVNHEGGIYVSNVASSVIDLTIKSKGTQTDAIIFAGNFTSSNKKLNLMINSTSGKVGVYGSPTIDLGTAALEIAAGIDFIATDSLALLGPYSPPPSSTDPTTLTLKATGASALSGTPGIRLTGAITGSAAGAHNLALNAGSGGTAGTTGEGDIVITGAIGTTAIPLRDITIGSTGAGNEGVNDFDLSGALTLDGKVFINHTGRFSTTGAITARGGFKEEGTHAAAANRIGGNITVAGISSIANDGIDFANGVTITTTVTFDTTGSSSGNADGPIIVPKGIQRSGGAYNLTLDAGTGTVTATDSIDFASLGTNAARLGTVAIKGGNVTTGPIFSSSAAPEAVAVTNSGVFTMLGNIIAVGGFAQKGATGTVEIVTQGGADLNRTITTTNRPISFASPINGDGLNPMNLTLNAWTGTGTAGTITFQNDVGNDGFKSLGIGVGAALTLNGNVVINKTGTGPAVLKAGGDIVFGNTPVNTHGTTLTSGGTGTNQVNVETTLAVGTVTFNGPVNGGVDFAVTSIDGDITFNGVVGGITPVGDNDPLVTAFAATSGTGTIVITKNLTAGGDIALNGKVLITSDVDLAVTANEGRIDIGTSTAHTVTLTNTGAGTPQVTIKTDDSISGGVAPVPERDIHFYGAVTGPMNLLVGTYPRINPNRSKGEVYFDGHVDVGSTPKLSSGPEPYALKVDAEKLTLAANINLITRYGGDVMMRVNGLDFMTGTHYLYAGALGAPGGSLSSTGCNGMAQITTREEGMEIEYGDTQRYSSSIYAANPVAFFTSDWTAIYALSYTVGDEDHYGAIYFTGVSNGGYDITVDNRDKNGSGANRGIVRFEGNYTAPGKTLNLMAKGIEVEPLDFTSASPPQDRPVYPAASPYSHKMPLTDPVTIDLGTANLVLNAPVYGATAGQDSLTLKGGNITLEKIVGGVNSNAVAKPLGTLTVNQSGTFTAKANITANLGFTQDGTPDTAPVVIAPADGVPVTITTAGKPIEIEGPVSSAGTNRSLVLTTGTGTGGKITIKSAVNLSGDLALSTGTETGDTVVIESPVTVGRNFTQTSVGTAVIGTASVPGSITAGGDITIGGSGGTAIARITGTATVPGKMKAEGAIELLVDGTVTGVDTNSDYEADTDLTLEAGTNYAGTVTTGGNTTVNFNRLVVNANVVNSGIIRAGQVMGPAAGPLDAAGDNLMKFGDGALPYPSNWMDDFAVVFNNGYSGSGSITGISGNEDKTYIAFRADNSLLGSSAPRPVIDLSNTPAPEWLVFLGNITQEFKSSGGNVPNVFIAHEYHIVGNPSSSPTGVRLVASSPSVHQVKEHLIIWRGFLDLNNGNWYMVSDSGTTPSVAGFYGYKGKLTLGKVQANKPIGEIQTGDFFLRASADFTLELLANADPNAVDYAPNVIQSSGAVNLYPGYGGSNPDADCPGWRELAEAHFIFNGTASFSTGLAGLAASRPSNPVPPNTAFFSSYDEPYLTIGALTVKPGEMDLRSDLSIQGDVAIEAGATLKADSGGGRYLVVRGGTDTIPGGWYQEGTFVEGQSTVNFTGYGSTPIIIIHGDTTWYNLVCETKSAILEFSTAPFPTSSFHEIKGLLRIWPSDDASIIRLTKIMTNGRFNAGENATFTDNPTSYTDYGAFWHIKLDDSVARVEMSQVNIFYSYAKIPIGLPAGVYANPYNEASTFPNWGYHFCMYWMNLKTFIYSFTEDSDGNGKIDRLRVQATLQITTPDFTGFKAEVEGYEIDSSRGNGGYDVISHSMDSIYIYLKEKTYQDGGATPRWRVLSGGNLRLNQYITVEPFQNWIISVDTVPPKVSYALMLPTGAASTKSELFVQLTEPAIRQDGARFLTINIPLTHDPYSTGSNRYITNRRAVATRNTYYMEYVISFNKADGFTVADLAQGEKYFTIEDGVDLALPIRDLFDPASPQYPSPKYPQDWTYSSYVTVRGNSGRYIDENGEIKTAPAGGYTDENGNSIGDGTGYALVPPNKLPPPTVLLPGAPADKYSHRVTDVLVSLPPSAPTDDQYFMWPIWAKTDDSPTAITVGSGWNPTPGTGRDDEYGLIWDFTGLRGLRDRKITLFGELNGALTGFFPSLFYAVSVHDNFRAVAGNGPPGLWLPPFNQNDFSNIVPKPFTGAYQKSPDSGTPPDYVFSLSDAHYDRGSLVEFFYRLDGGYTPLYAARLDMVRGGTIPEDWYRRIKPFSFKIIDTLFQRGGVTILNNVIDPTRGEKTYLEYALNRSGRVTIQVFTLDGSLVQILQRGSQGSGTYRVSWDGKNRGGRAVARGMYFIRAVGPEFDETRKVMVVK